MPASRQSGLDLDFGGLGVPPQPAQTRVMLTTYSKIETVCEAALLLCSAWITLAPENLLTFSKGAFDLLHLG